MSGFLLSTWGLLLLFGCLAMISLITACVMGVIEFRWKAPTPPPLEEKPDVTKSIESIHDFLTPLIGKEFAVRYHDGSFHVATTADCPLDDAHLVAALTEQFPRYIFAMRRLSQVGA